MTRPARAPRRAGTVLLTVGLATVQTILGADDVVPRDDLPTPTAAELAASVRVWNPADGPVLQRVVGPESVHVWSVLPESVAVLEEDED